MKYQKGGNKNPNFIFKKAFEQNIIEVSNDKLYFQQNKNNAKKYIKIHPNGILEYMGKFFLQNFNFDLDIVDNIAKLSDYTNKHNNTIFFNMKKLKSEFITEKKKAIYSNLFYEGKPISKFEKTKADKREKGIPWQSNDVTLNLTGEEGVNYVLGPNGSKLRMYIEKDDEKLIKVQLVNPSNWPYEKVLKFIDELNTGKLIYKYTRKRRGEISKLNRRKRKNLNGEKKSE